MPWWGWLLVGWASAAVVAGLIVGKVAAKARGRERAARAHLYEQKG